MEIQEDVVIVGGGIAGLATALALKRTGVRSLVLEKGKELRATGAALGLLPNAWLALEALGVSTKLTSIYAPFQKVKVTNVTDGTVQEVLFPTGKDSWNMRAPRAVHRSALLEALAQELPADGIRYCSKLTSIQTLKHQGSTLAVLSLDDGTIIKSVDVVIGCDGVHSAVGRWLGLKAPIRSGRFAVRGLAVYPQGHGLTHVTQQFVARDIRAGVAALNDTDLYWFVTSKSTSSNEEDMMTKPPEFIQKRVLEDAADFPPIFLDVVRHCDLSTLTWAPLMFRVPWDLLLTRLYKDNITVAGDAMHPMTPDLAQGGCSSLEDAVVLGRHIGNSLAENGRIDSRALEGYVKERRWRAVVLISASYVSGWIQQGGSGWLKEFLRDKVFYKFFTRWTSNVVSYDCGKLAGVCLTTDENTTKKSE